RPTTAAVVAQPGPSYSHAAPRRHRLDGTDHLGEPIMRAPFGAVTLAISLTLGAFAAAAASEIVPPLGPFAAAVQPEIVPPPSRNVTPPGMTPGPEGVGPLIREEEPSIREELPAPPPEWPRWHRFVLPETTDAATFVTRDRTI